MYKKVFLILTLSLAIYEGNAQNKKNSSMYLNVGYGIQKFESNETNFLDLESSYAFALNWGNIFYLHRNPIMRTLKFGIDVTFIDLYFADYSDPYRRTYSFGKSYLFQLEAGSQIGPSMTINPVNKLRINAYYRYSPSFSSFNNGELKPYASNYAGFYVTGINISYKLLSIGVENRWGNADYKFDVEDDYGTTESIKKNWKTSGIWFFLGLRF